ncbi:MAG: hypothetical protein R3C14_20350 [Caldilineaceae bacterium]
MSNDRPIAYRIFLLTLWIEDATDLADPESWRFRLEEPKRGQRRGYVGMPALVAGLIQEVCNDRDHPPDQPPSDME